MATSKFDIIRPADYAAVAEIWVLTLPNDIFALLGSDFIKDVYLPKWASQPEAYGLVAREDNTAVGFVLFAESESLIGSILKGYWSKFLNAVVVSLFTRPLTASAVYFGVLRYMIQSAKLKSHTPFFELNYLCVMDSYRNKSLATNLVRSAIATFLEHSSIQSVYVKTLKETPATHRFYERLGFSIYFEVAGRLIFHKQLRSLF